MDSEEFRSRVARVARRQSLTQGVKAETMIGEVVGAVGAEFFEEGGPLGKGVLYVNDGSAVVFFSAAGIEAVKTLQDELGSAWPESVLVKIVGREVKGRGERRTVAVPYIE